MKKTEYIPKDIFKNGESGRNPAKDSAGNLVENPRLKEKVIRFLAESYRIDRQDKS